MADNFNILVDDYTIDFASNNNFLFIPSMQDDGYKTRMVRLHLVNHSYAYEVNPEEVRAVIQGRKSDGTQIFNECDILDDHSSINVEITPEMNAVSGKSEYEIAIISLFSNRVIKSFPFYIVVTKSAFEADKVTSSNEYGLLISKINQVQELEDQAKKNEAERVTQENIRISNENERISNENTRQSNEVTRQSNENTRISQEAARVKAENARVSAENTRVEAENLRINAEASRVEAENARVSAEVKREEDCAAAIDRLDALTDEAIAEVNAAGSDNILAVKAEGDTQVARVAEKGAEIIASLPEVNEAVAKAEIAVTSANNAANTANNAATTANNAIASIGSIQEAIDGTLINDTTSSNLTVYSSEKVESRISEVETSVTQTLENSLNNGALSTVVGTNLTANRALISNSAGKIAASTITATELSYLSGLLGNIQELLNGKQSTITHGTAEPTGGNSGDIYLQIIEE